MNCNTTHYRANSSSVPGDPTRFAKAKREGKLDNSQLVQFLNETVGISEDISNARAVEKEAAEIFGPDTIPTPEESGAAGTPVVTEAPSHSISPVASLEAIAAALGRKMSGPPPARIRVLEKASEALARLRRDWTEKRWTWKGDEIRPVVDRRTKAELDKEEAFRQADAFDRALVAEGLTPGDRSRSRDSREYEAWQRYQESRSLLLAKGFDETAAETLARASSARWKKEHVAAVKRALTAAKKEAADWRSEVEAVEETDWSPRAILLRSMRILDAVLAAAPAEVRGKVGGFISLARFKTEKAQAAEIERRIEMLNDELERHLKKEYTEQLADLFERAKPKKSEPGKKPMGKITADLHTLFNTMREARGWTAEQVNAHVAGLQSLITGETLNAAEEAHTMLEIELVQLVGDWRHADAARMAAAVDAAENAYQGGYLEWSKVIVERRERRERARSVLALDTGKAGKADERRERFAKDTGTRLKKGDKLFWRLGNAAENARGWAKDITVNLSDFRSVLEYAFGPQSAEARRLEDLERAASFQKEDSVQALEDEIVDFFTELGKGSPLEGEKIRFALTERTLDGGKAGRISAMEVIQATLMWRQEDGQRHMEAFGYDQAWIDSVESELSAEARRTREFLAGHYGAEYAPLNAVYRERHGVNLPSHAHYCPLTVKPKTANVGEMIDPVTGGTIAAGGGYTPSSLRTRSNIAAAEPDFRDALQVFLAHKRQLLHWMAYADFASEANAILLDRELGNSIEAAGGHEALSTLRKLVDGYSHGGFRDAGGAMAMEALTRGMTQRAATMALVGNIGTLTMQSLQLAAGIHEMPTGSFVLRFGKLMAGQLDWSGVFKTPFIHRRMREMPPIVRQAVRSLMAGKPNRVKYWTAEIGKTIPGADALFTAGTFAILLDWHRTKGARLGMSGAALDAHAEREAIRGTERVAQPTRLGTRSLHELTRNQAAMRLIWAFATQARQHIVLAAWALRNAKKDPRQFARTAFLVWGIGGAMSQVLRNAWRDMKDDDDEWEDKGPFGIFGFADEKNWSLKRLMLATMAGPLNGLPIIGQLIEDMAGRFLHAPHPDTDLLDKGAKGIGAADRLLTGETFDSPEAVEATMRDVHAVIGTLGIFNDTAAATSSLGHLVTDTARVIDGFHDDPEEAGEKELRGLRSAKRATDEAAEDERQASLTDEEREAEAIQKRLDRERELERLRFWRQSNN